MSRDLVGEMRIGLFHSSDCRIEVGITMRFAAFGLPYAFNPGAHPLRRRPVNAVIRRQAHALDRDAFLDAVRVNAGIAQSDDPTERVANEINREVSNDVGESGEIEDMFGD